MPTVPTEKTLLLSEEDQQQVTKAVGEKLKKAGENVGEKLKEAGGALKENVKTLIAEAKEGKAPMNVLVVIGGGAIVVTSVLNLFGNLITLNIIGFLIEILLIGGGTAAVLLEGGEKVSAEGFDEFIRRNIAILTSNSGRGLFYVILGLLKLSQFNLLNIIVGAYMTFVGVVYYVSGLMKARNDGTVSADSYFVGVV